MTMPKLIEALVGASGPFAVEAIETLAPDRTLLKQLRKLAWGPWPLDEPDATTDARVVALAILGLLRDEESAAPPIVLAEQSRAEDWMKLEKVAQDVITAIGPRAFPLLVDLIEDIELDHDIAGSVEYEVDSLQSNLFYEYWSYVNTLAEIALRHPE